MQLDTVILLPMSSSDNAPAPQTGADETIEAGDAALQLQLESLKSAFFALLAGLLTLAIGMLGVTQAIVRLAYAAFGLVVWTIGVWLLALHSLHAYCAGRGNVWKL